MNDGIWHPQDGFSHTITCPDRLDELNANGGLAVRFAPAGRSIQLSFAGSQSESLSVWRTATRTGFTTTPTLAADLITIRFVDRGALIRINRSGEDRIVGTGQALLTSFEVMRCEQATQAFSSISATVTRSAIFSTCRTLFGSESRATPLFESVVDSRSSGLRAARASVSALRDRITDVGPSMDLVLPLMEEIFLYQLVGSWPMAGDGKSYNEYLGDQTIRRAIDFIEGNLFRRIAIRDVAETVESSVRSLQTTFKRRMGCSPVQYILARRLDRVHAELRYGSAQSVRAVAMRWGFVHMSDFSARYKERFGRLPSDDILIS